MSNLVLSLSPGLLDDSVGKRLGGDDPLLVSGLGEGVNIFITLPTAIPEVSAEKLSTFKKWQQEAIDRFWNGPESPFEAQDGIEYIRPDVNLPVPTEKVMIRQDYKDIWAHMGLHPSESLIVIGHPGIGTPTVTGPRTSLSLEAVATCIIPTDFLFMRVMKVVIESGLAHREKMLRALKPLSAISDYAFKTLALTWCISDHLICQIDGKERDFVLSDVMTHSFDDLPILGDQADDLMFVCPEDFSTVDAFVVSADRSHIVFLQATIATKHPLKQGGVGQVLSNLLEHGVSFTQETRFSFIFVVPKDTDGQVLANHFNGAEGFSQYSPEKGTHGNPVRKYQGEVGGLDISLFPREALIEPEAIEEQSHDMSECLWLE
ncbi:uncharacterized protein BXZ73DRAFT_95493 [Epithele typhae]|uniref:uncharacterized protein n=1 Tax=Epithele typhae TaxID=378194 RepID=UPI0020083A4D|nr:uncharacterized protein BXZ73DRAFT_95493 [Epithele typhae]KAH9945978.1 hypothetical protein BXZ73DRAFT_95493 [Epithele typhae]